MGSAASKAAGKAPLRKYPSRAPGAAPAAAPQRPPQRPAQQPSQPLGSAESQQTAQPQTQRPRDAARASFVKDEAIRADGADPDGFDFPGAAFSDRLRQMGVVQPNPTFSPSSTAGDAGVLQTTRPPLQPSQQPSQHPRPQANATLSVLEARRRLQEDQAAEEGLGGSRTIQSTGSGRASSSSSTTGREFLTATTIKDILVLRSRGVDAAAIEARLHLKPGVVARLGPPGLVEALNVQEST